MIFQANLEEINNWYNKNKFLIKTLSLSRNDALFQKDKIDSIAKDLNQFFKKTKFYMAILLIVLFPLSLLHSFLFKDTAKLLLMISLYLGLSGAFIASYGFLFHVKGLIIKKDARTLHFPNIPNDHRGFPRYSYDLQRILQNYIDLQSEQQLHQVKVEIRKQISLAIGFGLIFFSFAIQIVLQFI